MDSPIRQQQKRNDYQRHKLFRKMARRRKAKKEQEQKMAEKELKRKLRIPRYEDGKAKYNIKTNDDSIHNFYFDENGNTVLDNGTVGSQLLDNVIVRPGVDVRQAIERKMDRLAKQSETIGFTDPISGEYNMPQGGPLESVYPEFDLIALWQMGGPLLRQRVERLLQNRTPSLGKPIINESFSQVRPREINVGAETTATPKYTDLLKREELGKYITEGGESTVYENDFFPGEVIKEKEGLFAPAKDFEELQIRINNDLLQNKLPNVVPLHYRGYVHDPSIETLVNGDKTFKRITERLNPVYSQKKITPATEMADPWHVIFKKRNDWPEVSDYYIQELNRLGYTWDSNGLWNVKGFPYKVGDLGPRNVGYDDFGNMLIFDPLIHYKYGKASGIHIKPENRGKFTALKKRTGKSASWFKAHGTPAQKKMATFALNARKWHHK